MKYSPDSWIIYSMWRMILQDFRLWLEIGCCWFANKMLLSSRRCIMFLQIICSMILHNTAVRGKGLQLPGSYFSPFLKSGTTWAFLQSLVIGSEGHHKLLGLLPPFNTSANYWARSKEIIHVCKYNTCLWSLVPLGRAVVCKRICTGCFKSWFRFFIRFNFTNY